jgi:PKD repeat protein
VANAGPDQQAFVDETIYFDASNSYDLNNVIVNGMWDFGDGNFSNYIGNESYNPYQISHTYTIPGNYTVILTVFDGLLYDTDTTYANVSIFIIPNAPPSVFIPDLEIYEDSYYTIDLWDKASDDRSPVEKLNFTILNISDPNIGVTLVSNRYISIKPTVNWFGNSTVTVQVSDGELKSTTTFKIVVIPVREPPWANAGGDLYIKLNQTVFFDGSGSMDSDGDILTNNWSFGDGTYTGWQNNSNASHSYNKTGKYKVTLTVSDSEFIDIDIIYVRVYANNTSKAPIIFDIPDIFIHYYGPEMSYDYFGYNYDFSYFIEDQDNKPEELTIWAEPFEQELSEYILPDENNSLGLIFKFPLELVNENKHQISLFVGDLNPRTNEIYKNFNITVVSDVWPVELIKPFNKLELEEDFVRVEDAFTLSNHFYDRDSANSYVIFNRMDNNIKAEIDDEMNIDIYTNQENFTGEEEILIVAHDEQPEQDLHTLLRIKVNPINDPPVISDIPIQIIRVNEENTLDLKDYIFDSDNSNSELLIDSSDPEHITINGSELIINYDTIGDKKVTLSVNDGEFTVTSELIISVIKDDEKPITGEDSDGDGLPDAWELKYGLNPNDSSDAGLDFDNDSLTNLEEYIKNTDPTNYDSDGDGYSDKVDQFPNDPGSHKKESKDDGDMPSIRLENVIAIILVVIVIIILLILSFIVKNKRHKETTFTPDDEVYSKVVHDILFDYQPNGDKLSNIEMKTILDEKFQNGELSQESHNQLKNLLDNMEQFPQENNK